MNLKIISLILIFAMCFSMFAACKDTSSGQIELVVVSPFDVDDSNHENYVNAYKSYEEASNVKINDKSKASDEVWKQSVLKSFEDGTEPDVLFFFTGADANDFVKDKKVVSITEIRSEYPDYASNMRDAMLPVSNYDGRQYALPVNGYWEGLFVNKKVLADCGIEIPGADYTWEQFIIDCTIIKDKGYTPIACSLNAIPHYWFEFCVFNNGSIVDHTNIPKSSDDKIADKWIKAFDDIKNLYDKGFFPESTTTMTDDEACNLMVENKAAFLLEGSWKVGWFQKNTENIDDFTVTYVPAKGNRRATDIVAGLSMGYYISRKAWNDPKKREACVKFITAMTTDEVVNSFGSIVITALKNGTTPLENADILSTDALEMTKNCTGIVSAAQDGLSVNSRNALFDDVKNIVTGKITSKDAIDKCLKIE
ncbi:extracellular solute-binding protein [Eubacteriales bacterium OttesenSCG-928-G02]|nr:extracellular solute-binding protein [Eubacteriales bacterium OttesenSCG-928-G02]